MRKLYIHAIYSKSIGEWSISSCWIWIFALIRWVSTGYGHDGVLQRIVVGPESVIFVAEIKLNEAKSKTIVGTK